MQTLKSENLPIKSQSDIVLIRREVRAWAVEIGFGIIDQTKVITAASELARNTLEYGLGGSLKLEILENETRRRGLRLVFEDNGPGIANVQAALTDGFTTGNGLGMGLSGSKRLMSEFEIETEIGKGTSVTATKWK